MKKLYILVLLLLFADVSVLKAQSDTLVNHRDAKALFALEMAFSNVSKEVGFIAANLRYAADDALVFRPVEINAREWSRQNSVQEYARKHKITNISAWALKNNMGIHDTSAVIVWTPSYVEMSLAGDLGYATGPFENQSIKPVAHGQFVTVWRRQADGSLKFIMDFGSNRLPPSFQLIHESPFRPNDTDTLIKFKAIDQEKETNDLLNSEAKLGQVCKTFGDVAAYKLFASQDIRFFYQTQFYVRGIDSIAHRLAQQAGYHIWNVKRALVSASGDLAHVYGTHQFIESGVIKEGYFMRLWKKQPDGRWTILVQVRNLVLTLPK